jgi:hypothetical protein
MSLLSLVGTKSEPMDAVTSEVLVKLVRAPAPSLDAMGGDGPAIARIIQSRIDSHAPKFNPSPAVVMMCSYLSKGVPGHAVLWAFTIVNDNLATMHDLAMAFPNGFPTSSEMTRVWVAQKCPTNGSLVDNPWTLRDSARTHHV